MSRRPVPARMSALDAIRRPESVGDRRCWPCTAVNVALVAGACLAVAALAGPLAALPVGAVGLAAVYLRGYVVPYTPRFAPRLVAAVPGAERLFEGAHGPTATATADGGPDRAEPGSLAGGDEVDPERLLEALLAADVLASTEAGLTPTPAFREEWEEAIADLRGRDPAGLAAAVEAVAPVREATAIEGDDRCWIALDPSDGGTIEDWLPRPVAIGSAAAARALASRVEDAPTRLAAADALLAFREACPACGTALVESTTVACCGGNVDTRSEPDDVLLCPACDVPLARFDGAA